MNLKTFCMMASVTKRYLNEYIRKESNNNDDEGGEVEVGVCHQGSVHIEIHRLREFILNCK